MKAKFGALFVFVVLLAGVELARGLGERQQGEQQLVQREQVLPEQQQMEQHRGLQKAFLHQRHCLKIS
jgi:hypothetical protein